MTSTQTSQRLRGSLTALVTPFRDGAFDEHAFRAFVAWQIENGTHGLVPTGTTGESPTLSHSEHDRVVEACIDEAGGKVPVVAGAAPTPLHRGGDRAVPSCGEGRRGRAAHRHALLQQADAGRAVPALQGGERCGRHSHPDLQHPRPLGDRHERRHHGAALRAAEHRRVKDATANVARVSLQRQAMGRRLRPTFWRRCDRPGIHGAWRPRHHLGGLERRAAPLRRLPGSLPRRRLPQGAHAPGPADAAPHPSLRRDQPVADEVRAGPSRPDERGGAPADGAVGEATRALVDGAMRHAGLTNG